MWKLADTTMVNMPAQSVAGLVALNYDPTAVTGMAVINVMLAPYGAKGDGVTDDGPAIQRAVAAASLVAANPSGIVSPIGVNSVPTVYFPAGNYYVATGVTVNAYINFVGENSFIQGPGTVDLFTFSAAYQASFTKITFSGARNQVLVTSSVGNIWFDQCFFISPGAAGFATLRGSNQGYFHFSRCQFESSILTGNMMNCVSGDDITIVECDVQSYQTLVFVFQDNVVTIRSMFATPGTQGMTWFKFTNSTLRVTDSHFGGEHAAVLAEYRSVLEPGYGVPEMLLGFLVWERNVAYASPIGFKFFQLPKAVSIKGCLGTAVGFYWDPGITDYSLHQIISTGNWDIDLKDYTGYQSFWLDTAISGSATIARDMWHLLQYRPFQVPTKTIPATDVVGVFTSVGTGGIASAAGPSGGLVSTTGLGQIPGPYGTVWNQFQGAAEDGSAFNQFFGALFSCITQPGTYTAVFSFKVFSDHIVLGSATVNNNRIDRHFNKGEHLISIPFVIRQIPKFWSPSTSYAVGDIIQSLGSLGGGIGLGYYCFQAGTSSATGNGPVSTNGPTAPEINGTSGWAYLAYAVIEWRFQSLPIGAIVGFGNCRIYKGLVDPNTINAVVHSPTLPTSGYWQVGDIVNNDAPAAAGFLGWICTTSGNVLRGSWAQSSTYALGDLVTTGTFIYMCVQAGVSLGTGVGPVGYTFPAVNVGTTPYFTDNTCRWQWRDNPSAVAVFKTFGAISP